jgi:hypothetical protein
MLALLSAACTGVLAGLGPPARPVRPGAQLPAHVARAIGVRAATIVRLDGPAAAGAPFRTAITIDGIRHAIDLTPHSVRSASYSVRRAGADGTLAAVPPGPVTTFRGSFTDDPGTVVAAGVVGSGLQALIARPDGGRYWLEPLERFGPAYLGAHALYRSEDVLETDHGCAAIGDPEGEDDEGEGGGAPIALGGSDDHYVAELAIDADYEYFLDWGAATEARVNALINAVDVQYERDVLITHEISAIVIRTAPTYPSTDPQTLLEQFRDRWLTQHGDIPRDLAHLLTGKELNGNTVGIAWGVGEVCTNGAYSLAQSDFNGAWAYATDLTAHELGHLWNGAHCTCPTYTMNPVITAANIFAPATIADIVSHRNSRWCLDVPALGVYCTASGASSAFEYIARVTVGSIDHSSGRTGYSDFTAVSTDMVAGGTYPITVTLGSGFLFDVGGLWIDWDHDADFGDEGEAITTAWSGPGPYSTTITVPATAPLGATRMRVRIHDGASNPLVVPCGVAAYGEVEDYTVVVLDGAASACCFEGGTCAVISEAICTLAGGTWVPLTPTCDGACPEPCPADLDGDGAVGEADLAQIFPMWGPCAGCTEDLTGDGAVGFADLLRLLSAWGDCP